MTGNRYITALGSGNVTFISKDYRAATSDSPERGVIVIPSGYTLDTEKGILRQDDHPGNHNYPLEREKERDFLSGRVATAKG